MTTFLSSVPVEESSNDLTYFFHTGMTVRDRDFSLALPEHDNEVVTSVLLKWGGIISDSTLPTFKHFLIQKLGKACGHIVLFELQ